MIKKWKDVKIGDKFPDGSTVIQVHPSHIIHGYEVTYLDVVTRDTKRITLSKDHYLLVDISYIKNKNRAKFNEIRDKSKKERIPIQEDLDIKIIEGDKGKGTERALKKYFLEGELPYGCNSVATLGRRVEEDLVREETIAFNYDIDVIIVKAYFKPVRMEKKWVGKNRVWMKVQEIAELMEDDLYLLNSNYNIITKLEEVGRIEARCVSTDTGLYETNGLIHHNSVTLRNIIFHCIQHENEINIALIDPKNVEFISFRGMKGILAVANTIEEACEVTRIGRKVMLKRNIEMAKLGINNITDFTPSDYSGKVWVTGREMYGDEKLVVVNDDGTEEEITAEELEKRLN